MSAMLETLEGLLALEVALNQWDAPPTLGLLVSEGDVITVETLHFSEKFWALGELHDVLTAIALGLSRPGHPPFPYRLSPGQALEGLAFFCEGWALSSEGMTRKQMIEASEFAAEFGVHAHPARIECKMVSAVDLAGGRYAVQHPRGKGTGRSEDSEGDLQLGGRLFDALDRLLVEVRREVLS